MFEEEHGHSVEFARAKDKERKHSEIKQPFHIKLYAYQITFKPSVK